MRGVCDRCFESGEVRHYVLVDYTPQSGGWEHDGMYCDGCIEKIVDFMNGEVTENGN